MKKALCIIGIVFLSIAIFAGVISIPSEIEDGLPISGDVAIIIDLVLFMILLCTALARVTAAGKAKKSGVYEKSNFKIKVWEWVVLAIAIVMFPVAGMLLPDSSESETEVLPVIATAAPTDAPTVSQEDIEREYKEKCVTVTYEELARYPDKYKGKDIVVTGKVNQALDKTFGYDIVKIWMYEPDDEEYSFDYLNRDIMCNYEIQEDMPRILEDDEITVYGEFQGVESYITVLGAKNTIPSIRMNYYEIG